MSSRQPARELVCHTTSHKHQPRYCAAAVRRSAPVAHCNQANTSSSPAPRTTRCTSSSSAANHCRCCCCATPLNTPPAVQPKASSTLESKHALTPSIHLLPLQQPPLHPASTQTCTRIHTRIKPRSTTQPCYSRTHPLPPCSGCCCRWCMQEAEHAERSSQAKRMAVPAAAAAAAGCCCCCWPQLLR